MLHSQINVTLYNAATVSTTVYNCFLGAFDSVSDEQVHAWLCHCGSVLNVASLVQFTAYSSYLSVSGA